MLQHLICNKTFNIRLKRKCCLWARELLWCIVQVYILATVYHTGQLHSQGIQAAILWAGPIFKKKQAYQRAGTSLKHHTKKKRLHCFNYGKDTFSSAYLEMAIFDSKLCYNARRH